MTQERSQNKKTNTKPHNYKDTSLFKVMWYYLSPYKLTFALIVILLLVVSALAIITPLIFRKIVLMVENEAFTPKNREFMIWGAIAYFSLSIIAWILRITEFAIIRVLNARFIRDLRIDVFKQLLENKVSFFDKNESGDLTSRIINDTKELQDYINAVGNLITVIFRLIVILAVLFYLAPLLTLSTLILYPFIIIFSLLLGKYQRRVSREWRKKLGKVNQRFSESMKAIQVSKAFHREQENINRFDELNEATYQASVKRGFAIFIFWPISDLLRNFILITILFVGVWEVKHGLPIATLIIFILLLDYYYYPLISLAENYHKFQGIFANLDRVMHVAQGGEEGKETTTNGYKALIKGKIEFKDYTFGYNPENPVLQDINFTVEPGQRIALVGHTGAGKTTIAALLFRFYENPVNGEILIDDIPIQNWDLYSLRSQMSLVSQKVLLFRGTIRENLLISNPKATDEEIWSALRIVQAEEFIEHLPGKLDYEVTDGGKNLSTGQRQMISFARAILANPKIIVLDEATSAIDLYTESKIQDAIEKLLQNRTSITIAHRLTTIIKSDKIIVLDKGQIKQIGTHQELIQVSGPYKDMYDLYFKTQSAKYLEQIKITPPKSEHKNN